MGSASRGIGVCYDFQNRGHCRRGENCHFSHCACDTTCHCTGEKNTFGRRPSFRDEEPENKMDEQTEEEIELTEGEEQGEVIESTDSNIPLSKFDKVNVAGKLKELNSSTNNRIWAQLE